MFNKMKLSTKLYGGFLILVALIVVQAAISLAGARSNSENNAATIHTLEVLMAVEEVRLSLTGIVISRT